ILHAYRSLSLMGWLISRVGVDACNDVVGHLVCRMAIVTGRVDRDHLYPERADLLGQPLREAVDVDQNIDLAKPFDGFSYHCVDLVLPGDIEFEDECLRRVAHDQVADPLRRPARNDSALPAGQDRFAQGPPKTAG